MVVRIAGFSVKINPGIGSWDDSPLSRGLLVLLARLPQSSVWRTPGITGQDGTIQGQEDSSSWWSGRHDPVLGGLMVLLVRIAGCSVRRTPGIGGQGGKSSFCRNPDIGGQDGRVQCPKNSWYYWSGWQGPVSGGLLVLVVRITGSSVQRTPGIGGQGPVSGGLLVLVVSVQETPGFGQGDSVQCPMNPWSLF